MRFWAERQVTLMGGQRFFNLAQQGTLTMLQLAENELHLNLNILDAEPAEAYHARAGQFFSSHQLMDFMKCPWLYCKKQSGLIKKKESAAYLLGRAAHCRILEGRSAYDASFALGGPVNPKTGKPFGTNTKAFVDWQSTQNKPVLSHAQVALIEQMASGVAMNDEAVDLLLYGRSEGVLRTKYCTLPSQIRIDWLHPHRGIVDLKTCDDLAWFESDARRYRYANQMAFYQSVLAVVIGESVPVYLVAVEKREPFRCGVWRLGDHTLAKARRENEAAIERLILCRERDHWPTCYESIRVLEFP